MLRNDPKTKENFDRFFLVQNRSQCPSTKHNKFAFFPQHLLSRCIVSRRFRFSFSFCFNFESDKKKIHPKTFLTCFFLLFDAIFTWISDLEATICSFLLIQRVKQWLDRGQTVEDRCLSNDRTNKEESREFIFSRRRHFSFVWLRAENDFDELFGRDEKFFWLQREFLIVVSRHADSYIWNLPFDSFLYLCMSSLSIRRDKHIKDKIFRRFLDKTQFVE